MPLVRTNKVTIHYEEQGTGDPLILIPYLSADHACYAFQVAGYAKHFACISVDLRGTGESDDPEAPYSTEQLADDVASFLQAKGIQKAHVSGLSLGAAVGIWFAAKYPEKVQTLSLHSAWPRTDLFVKTVIESWQSAAKAVESIPEMVIRCIFPWCFTPELYSAKSPTTSSRSRSSFAAGQLNPSRVFSASRMPSSGTTRKRSSQELRRPHKSPLA